MATVANDRRDGLLDGAPGGSESFRAFALTESNVMFSMGWPMLVSFFARMAMASVDSAFVGHINNGVDGDGKPISPGTYLAAAGLADMVTGILVIPPLAFNQSLNMLVSQAIGSGNKKLAGTWLQLSLFWLTVGYLPVLPSFFYVEQMLLLLGFDKTTCHLAGVFAMFNVFWPIPNGWYQCMRFYFQAMGVTRPAMWNNLMFLAVNILLNWIFVFGGPFRYMFGWQGLGFVGAAISLSISRSSQPLAYWLYMFFWKQAHLETWPGWSWKFLQKNKEFLSMAVPQIGTLILQAAIGQSTTLLLAQLGPQAVAASAATAAATQVFTGGLQTALTAMGGIRVGYWLGMNDPVSSSRVGWVAFGLGGVATIIVSAFLLPLAPHVMAVVTSDQDVIDVGSKLLPAVMLNIIAGIAVEVGTGGVLTSQGRPVLVTVLSFAFELPCSLGVVAFLVLFTKADLQFVYWAQAIVMVLEAIVVWMIIIRSNWAKYAQDAQERQDDMASPLPSPALVAGRGSPAAARGKTTPMQSPMLGHPPTREIIDCQFSAEPDKKDRDARDPLVASGVSLPERRR